VRRSAAFTAPAHADTCAGLSLAALAPAGVGTAPNAVAVGDFNRDGKMDVAVVNKGAGNVSILLGNGSGGFTAGPNSPIATGASNPIDIATGDLDRDGILDLVVAFEGLPARAEVLRGLWGTGGVDAGKFTAGGPFTLAANENPTRIYLAHFTNDADLDLVVLAENTQMILLYGGATGVAFGAAPLASLDLSFPLPGESPSGAAAVDFDRDGDLDLAVTMRNTNLLRVYTGDGLGGLASGAVGASTGTGPRDITAGDIDRDGWPDLVTADSGSSSASVLFNLNGGSLTPQNPVLVGGVPTRVALVDLDHDGVLDLAALDDSTTPRVSAFRGLTVGPDRFDNAAAAASLPASEAHGLAVGRFTADGRADLVSVSALSVPPQLVVVENRSGTPCARSSFAGAPRSYPAGSGPVSTAAADFDEDGRKDLVVASTSDLSVRVLKNVNGGFSSGPAIGPLSPAPRAVAVADMDVDGDMDVVVAQGAPGSGMVQVFLGDGVGGLASFATQTAGNNLSALVTGDFNGDGAPDVASTSEGSAQVFVFLGNGVGGLVRARPSPSGPGRARWWPASWMPMPRSTWPSPIPAAIASPSSLATATVPSDHLRPLSSAATPAA
jgi:hypothetical protein